MSKLLIPGPVPVDEDVLQVLSEQPESHTSLQLREDFSSALKDFRELSGGDASTQPFILSGGGSLAWDAICSSFRKRKVEDRRALVLNTGFFSDRFNKCLSAFEWQMDEIDFGKGGAVDLKTLERFNEKVATGNYALVAMTHVDTSTGIRNDVEAVSKWLCALFDESSGGDSQRPLFVVDGVCSVGAEQMAFSHWHVDVLFTASQKALSVPPGLCLLLLSQRALAAMQSDECKAASLYSDLNQWLPVMQKYENKEKCYFSTPATGLIRALARSLRPLVTEGMEAVNARHKQVAAAFRQAMLALELELVPSVANAADTLSAVFVPNNCPLNDFLAHSKSAHGFTFAGGLYSDLKRPYFRVGHMGFATKNPRLFADSVKCIEDSLIAVNAISEAKRGTAEAAFIKAMGGKLAASEHFGILRHPSTVVPLLFVAACIALKYWSQKKDSAKTQ